MLLLLLPIQLVVKEAGKDSMQLQRLSTQLEEARAAVAKLQQYEVLYKESRMRTKQMQAEVTALQVREAPSRQASSGAGDCAARPGGACHSTIHQACTKPAAFGSVAGSPFPHDHA